MGVSSCSFKDDTLNFQVEFIPVESIEFPEYMQAGETYELKVYYKKPNDCYYFDGFYTEKGESSEVLAVQTLVIQNAKCESLEDEEPEFGLYEFTCPNIIIGTFNNVYLFEVYKGDDGEGNMIFETVEVPIGQE
ncbi:hypothetical protein DVK85_05600 [Flavobacterium arcticum]|uniref:Uncharacterized protein n=2 Tax=Flavobacterium arcticum TaxID=1784713 RepID=A0A345HAX5_9FLAO|nr:hypothetical protein DVK85_05600 [Flavobacterium arcticum]